MSIVNFYHGCEISSSDDQRQHEVVCDGRSLGSFPTLADAIEAARCDSEAVVQTHSPCPDGAENEERSAATNDALSTASYTVSE